MIDPWKPIETAPRNGKAFLAYGYHDRDNGRHWSKGDNWIAILRYDVWRPEFAGKIIFSKDGTEPWSPPLGWTLLPIPLPEGILPA